MWPQRRRSEAQRWGRAVARWLLEVCDCARGGREETVAGRVAGGALRGEGTAAAGWPQIRGCGGGQRPQLR
ncbi:putative basolateral Na-K-2Cl cotransporter [Sesbania bispinosa]|nr:putative basolateral Na-K-2Cl cotransporter [Sesbania bispinosa]